MAEETGSVLTMCDVLEEERELEEDANAVLGGSDDTNCTYDVGYVPRQALYACKTCASSSGDSGGICLACSLVCHTNHELVELYTKRNFRCDCGNKKFKSNPCRLCPKKDDFNSQNSYNQNFEGLYCSCSRPYPDATDNIQDEMIQCVICEDWYHGRHLTDDVPDNEDYGEMICTKCMKCHNFLSVYKAHFEAERQIVVDDVKDVKTENCDPSSLAVKTQKDDVTAINGIKSEADSVKTEAQSLSDINSDGKASICTYQAWTQKNDKVTMGPAFLPEGWRNELCSCSECVKMYEKESCSFLLDERDTIQAYEELGKNRNGEQSQYDKGLSALSQLDRVKQIEAIYEYNSMKSELKDYLKTFADAKRTVSEKDITDFFDGMRQRKRQRVGNYIPHFCR